MSSEAYRYKPYLFSIAYNMLGEVEAAEDIVQDAFEKWLTVDHSKVTNEKAYLSRIVMNKSIDRLEKLKKEREAYKGTWLPEPVVYDTLPAEEEYNLDFAILFLLEKLNPYERAVLVLRESFDMDYAEIAELLGMSNDNCRQVLHRAKEKVKSPARRQQADPDRKRELLDAFLSAVHSKDPQRLQALLKEDIVMYSDGGGKVPAALNPLPGSEIVAKFFLGLMAQADPALVSFRSIYMNGDPAAIILYDGNIISLITAEVEDGKIVNIYNVRNPDKIRYKAV